MAPCKALIDLGVAGQEAWTYADATRQETDVHAERVKVTADAATWAAQEVGARETVAQVLHDGQEVLAAVPAVLAGRGQNVRIGSLRRPTPDRLPASAPADTAGSGLPPAATIEPRLVPEREPTVPSALAPDRVPFNLSRAGPATRRLRARDTRPSLAPRPVSTRPCQGSGPLGPVPHWHAAKWCPSWWRAPLATRNPWSSTWPTRCCPQRGAPPPGPRCPQSPCSGTNGSPARLGACPSMKFGTRSATTYTALGRRHYYMLRPGLHGAQ